MFSRRLATVTIMAGLAMGAPGCSPLRPDLPATLKLAIGQAAPAGDARVTLIALVSDSRCPMNALCIQAGDVVVRVEIRIDDRRSEFDLALRDPTRKNVSYLDYAVELEAVEPYPAGQPIPPADVRATFRVTGS